MGVVASGTVVSGAGSAREPGLTGADSVVESGAGAVESGDVVVESGVGSLGAGAGSVVVEPPSLGGGVVVVLSLGGGDVVVVPGWVVVVPGCVVEVPGWVVVPLGDVGDHESVPPLPPEPESGSPDQGIPSSPRPQA